MKTLIYLPILVLVIFAVVSLAYSQGTTSGLSKNDGHRQQNAGNNKSNTNTQKNATNVICFLANKGPKATIILPVHLIYNPDPNDEQDQRKYLACKRDRVSIYERWWSSICEWWERWFSIYIPRVNAIATLVIAVFTGLLWWSTRRMWKATMKAADAAKESADALPTVEKAFMLITNIEWKPRQNGANFKAVGDNIIEVSMFNGGKTPAILSRVLVTHALRKGYPTREEIENLDKLTLGNTVVRSGESIAGRIEITLSQDQWAEMARHRTKLLCYGRIEYTDIFGKSHETGFCWECPNAQGSTLAICDTKDLNYYT